MAVSVFGRTLVQLGTAHATSGLGSLAVAVGANTDASAPGIFNSAFALGAGSDATAVGGLGVGGIFDTAITVGTNDVATAGARVLMTPPMVPGKPGLFEVFPGSNDLAAVLGNMQTATATGANRLVDIVTPFGTL